MALPEAMLGILNPRLLNVKAPAVNYDRLYASYVAELAATPTNSDRLAHIARQALDLGRATTSMETANLASLALQAATGDETTLEYLRSRAATQVSEPAAPVQVTKTLV